jgi:topoisomerase-4 subunit B
MENSEVRYTEDEIKSLDWKEHIRMRPGMYIGKTGDGTAADDGIYILLKEVLDNSIDEFVMGNGKTIDVQIKEAVVKVRDYGRGIPLGKVIECVSRINTGGKYDSKAFKKSVGLNGVGTKAVNALSAQFRVESIRDGKIKAADFERGELVNDEPITDSSLRHGTRISFVPDEEIFKNFKFRSEYVSDMLWNYAYLNRGLRINYNGEEYFSENGLLDLLNNKLSAEPIYPVIHLVGEDIEVAITHTESYGEEYYSFVNGQHTTQGGTHQGAFREAYVKVIRDFFGKNFEAIDVRSGLVATISVKVIEPVFESQTKTKLGSNEIEPNGQSMRAFVHDFLARELDNFLHKNPDVVEPLQKKILRSERERKELAGIKKAVKKMSKEVSLHNRKLRDCRVHLNDMKENAKKENSTLFITEGDSASGSITKARDVTTQAVFSLKGKPLNCFGLTKKIVYQNEEFNLLQAALNIEDGIDGLRYNRIVIATDADVDGMHIRLLMITFFLQFFPDLVKAGHLYVLETPLFRVRNKQETIYCYSEEEKQSALAKLKGKPEITRFKGLGEISPGEFSNFIGDDIRLSPVFVGKDTPIHQLLGYYMGKNTPERQKFIIENLKIEKDLIAQEI